MRTRNLIVLGVLVAGVWFAPAPLLPPHRVAEWVQKALGIGWKAAYLAAAVALSVGFFGTVGFLAGLVLPRAASRRRRVAMFVLVPVAVAFATLAIRAVKLGAIPVWSNVALPVSACLVGALLGYVLMHRGWKTAFAVGGLVGGVALWGLWPSVPGELRHDIGQRLMQIAAAGRNAPSGDARFGVLVQAAFARAASKPSGHSALRENRAAVIAMGIALGHDRLATLAGLDPQSEPVRAAVAVRAGTSLRGREDWVRHFSLSAALAVLESPLVSDAGGLIKEELDAVGRGSGFSFGDLAADRAGVRFAEAATGSESSALAMQQRLSQGFAVDDFFPPAADLPENLTVEQFRGRYGRVGSAQYRDEVDRIDARLDRCAGLAGK